MSMGAMLLSLAGGLGLFLFGMNLMSEAIEKAAGAKLRGILEMFTRNRFMGMVVGTIFTAMIQSSSACTVMVVSFVNSGLMSLYQAAGVIFGANIGTTVTSQLVSFNLSEAAPVFVLAGVIGTMFFKKEIVTRVSHIVLGFGVLFMGLSGMSGAMSGMRDIPQVVNLLTSLDSPLLAILVGCLLTAVIQSSSVTVSIILLMANQELLQLPICLFTILGCNIGACTTALLASLSGKKDAKRAALIHFLFNVFGTILMYVILKLMMGQVVELIHFVSGDNAGRFVANAHTIFKVFQVIVLFPFAGLLVKMTYLLVPGEDAKVDDRDSFVLEYIGNRSVFNPTTAVVEVKHELQRMATLASENLTRAMNALTTLDQEDIDTVYETEKNINYLNHAITDYLVKINQDTLPIEDRRSIGALFHIANDIERIGDHAENVADAAVHRKETGLVFTKEAQRELGKMLDMVISIIRYSVEMFFTGADQLAGEIERLENAIDNMERKVQKSHIERLAKGACSPEASAVFSDLASGLERVADHATNIAFAMQNAAGEPERDQAAS
ncbi:MAG: Na/Pi cotransporter family protein [Eubacteriales bacterium]|nr:Na/Pi cotransporter family protein [Eubacteriales bacterium]